MEPLKNTFSRVNGDKLAQHFFASARANAPKCLRSASPKNSRKGIFQRFLLSITIFLFVVTFPSTRALSTSESLVGLLPQTKDQGVMLDKETFEAIQAASDQFENAAIRITNLKARSTVQNLSLIQGTAPRRNVPVFATLVTDARRAISIGTSAVNDQGEFSIVVTESLGTVQGEVLLLLSQIPDFTLSALLPKEILVYPIIIDHGASVGESEVKNSLGFYLQEISAWEGNQKVTVLPGDTLTLYREFPDQPLTLFFNGQIFHFSENARHELQIMVIPTLEQIILPLSVEANGQFQTEGQLRQAEAGQTLQLITHVIQRAATVRESSPIVTSVAVANATEFPSLHRSLFIAFKNQVLNLVLMTLIIILSIMIVKAIPKKYGDAKRVGWTIIMLEFGFLLWSHGTKVIDQVNRADLLFSESKTPFTVGRRFPEPPAMMTLTKLDDNLELAPGMATSWSQISDREWEFALRAGVMSPDDAVSHLKHIQSGDRPDKKYLSTVSDISTSESGRLLIRTRAPDPLLPKKLSRVNLQDHDSQRMTGTERTVTLQAYPKERFRKRNENSFELPFLSDQPLYEKVLIEDDRDLVKKLIEEQSVDLFDEPEVGVWPALSKQGYKILPKLNTEIVVLLTNRENFFLKNPELIFGLRKVLQTTRILQTSYFQYGRLGSQFAPPGVVGFFSKLKKPEEPREPGEIFNAVQGTLATDAITLKLHYPEEEKKLALVIEGELEREGLNIIPVEVPRQKFESALLTKLPDLILVPLHFELGDVSPFLDAFIDSKSPFNNGYSNAAVDALIEKSRTELNAFKRLKILHSIMEIITIDDPAGIPILFKKSFVARKNEKQL